jgi:hypothetical protein
MRRRWIILAGGIVVVLGVAALVTARGGRSGVTYQGRSVEAWFGRICRAEAALGGQQELRGTPNHRAFRAMGTNALPFLVGQAMDLRPTSAARSNLYRLFLHAPDWAGRGRFAPWHFAAQEASELIEELRPPMTLLLPLLEPALAGTNKYVRGEAIRLLGCATGNPEATVPHLVRALTQPEDGTWETRFERRHAALTLRRLRLPASVALPAVLATLAQPSLHPVLQADLLGWLIQTGPTAAPAALPQVEPLLDQPQGQRQVLAALAVHALQPGHPGAVEILLEAAEDQTSAGQDSLCQALVSYASRYGWPDPLLADLLEPLAAASLKDWTPSSSSLLAAQALEKAAPDRAQRLYEATLPADAGPIAAFLLLQMDGQHRGATETLVRWSRDEVYGSPRLTALLWLGFASPSNELAVATLEAASRRVNRPDVQVARQALEHMAEARARAGSPPDDGR